MGMPVVIGGDNLPSPVQIGLTDLPNIGGGGSGPPSSGITDLKDSLMKEANEKYFQKVLEASNRTIASESFHLKFTM